MALFPQTKSAKIFWAVGFLAVVFFLFAIGYGYYDQWQGRRQVEKMAEALRQAEQEIFNRKANDKIGGKTPNETLDLFIKAVESGDYELASKYFVVEKQEEELKSLQNSKRENIANVMGMLEQAKKSNGSYLGEDKFFIDDPISVDFVLYPAGNWKIEKI